MVFLELVEDGKTDVVYDYMPEKESAARGTISVNKTTRERNLIKKSPDEDISWYRGHVWQKIDEMLDSGVLEEKTCAAWY